MEEKIEAKETEKTQETADVNQCCAQVVQGENVNIEQACACKVEAEDVNVRQGCVFHSKSKNLDISQGFVGVNISKKNVNMNMAGAKVLVAKENVHMEKSGAIVLLGNSIEAENCRTVFFMGKNVEGNIETKFGPKETKFMAVALAAVATLVVFLAKALFGGKKA